MQSRAILSLVVASLAFAGATERAVDVGPTRHSLVLAPRTAVDDTVPITARPFNGELSRVPTPAAVLLAANALTAAELESTVRFLASDELLGRSTPSPGLDTAAAFLARQFARMGVRPLGSAGSYFQRVPVQIARPDTRCAYAELGGQRFGYPRDFGNRVSSAYPEWGAGFGPNGGVSGRLVYVQEGFTSKSLGIDPFNGLDVRGKIIVSSGEPGGLASGPTPRAGDLVNSWRSAAARGAIGGIIIPAWSVWANWERDYALRNRQRAVTRVDSSLRVRVQTTTGVGPGVFSGTSGISFPLIVASPQLADAIFRGERLPTSEIVGRAIERKPVPSFELDSAKVFHFNFCVKTSPATAQNIIGVLEGSDPRLRREYVVVLAHYDGQGINNHAIGGDSINHAADDNASGSAAVLAIARAFTRGPRPRRSVMFIWFAGEEGSGLAHAGSEYFIAHPPAGVSQFAASLEMDMIGRADGLPIVARGSDTTLRNFALWVNDNYLKTDLIADPSGHAGGSDNDSFLMAGVPHVSYADGKKDAQDTWSHTPGDNANNIDYRLAQSVARTVYVTAWRLANAPVMTKH